MRRNLSTHALKRFCACFGFGSFFATFFSPIPTYQLISANAKVVSCTLLLLLHVVAAAAAAAVVVVVALAGNVVKMLIF